MNLWTLPNLRLEPRHPEILASSPDARAIALRLPAGESLQEHQVHERAWLVVADGEAQVSAGDSGGQAAGAGSLVEFVAGERHEVRAVSDCTLLLLLTPWPGDGHPGAMSLEDKATARERARSS